MHMHGIPSRHIRITPTLSNFLYNFVYSHFVYRHFIYSNFVSNGNLPFKYCCLIDLSTLAKFEDNESTQVQQVTSQTL